MLSLLVAKQALKDDFFIRGDTPISSRMFFVQGACCLFIFLVFKLRVKRILVHFYFQLFRLYISALSMYRQRMREEIRKYSIIRSRR